MGDLTRAKIGVGLLPSEILFFMLTKLLTGEKGKKDNGWSIQKGYRYKKAYKTNEKACLCPDDRNIQGASISGDGGYLNSFDGV